MLSQLLLLVGTTALLLGSPGPTTLALAGCGATFGINHSLRFLAGILSGLVLVIIVTSVGVIALLIHYPIVKWLLQLLSAAYVIWIAIKIAKAPLGNWALATVNTPSFSDGFLLNSLNPKAYAAFIALFSQFLLPFDNAFLSHVATGLVCLKVAILVDVLWLLFGALLSEIFNHNKWARPIRIGFASLMVVTVLLAFSNI